MISISKKCRVRMPAQVKRFGFYVARKAEGEGKHAGQTAIFFTNHVLNDLGPLGHGTLTDPTGTNFKLLVFDASRWLGADTWLVASHFSDRGNHGGHGDRDGGDEDDDLDILFTVTGLGVTATHPVSFARVKALYR